jgi:hypothetical protein
MATTDQGGLNWKLDVTDGFTGPLQQFTQLVTQAKAAMDAFKGDKNAFTASVEQLKQLTELTKAQTAASRENRATTAQANREELAQQRELAAALKAKAAAEKERGAIVRAQKADQEAAARAALGLDAAIAKSSATLKAAGDQADRNNPKVKGLATQFDNMRKALIGGGEAGNRLVFTLRNIIGVGAGLAFIQKLQQGFSDLLRSGIAFNASVEDTQIGIAGLLTAVVDVKDAQGNLVTGAQAFAATQVVAIRQTEQLRQATLRTTATFEQLAETFQIAVAPGLKAGLDVDQIRELAVSVSQAAGALGVPTNQLSEEIRALLTGTIQARTTRIATALGIRPEDIARAKNDVGGLAKFLDDRFRAFELAGERAAGTFTGTFNRARVAISLAAGDASAGLFEEIRTSFLTVFDTFTQRDAFGKLLPDEKAVRVLKLVFDGISDAVRTLRTNLQQISFDSILSSAQTVGSIFRGIGEVLSGFIRGAIDGFGTLGRIFRAVFGNSVDLVSFSQRLGEIIVVVGTIGAAFAGIRVVISTLILPLSALVKSVETLGAALKILGLTNPFTLLLVSAIGLGFAIRELISLNEDLARIQEASTPEQQLSKQTILRQKIIDLLKEQEELTNGSARRQFFTGNGVDEKRLETIRQQLAETRKLLELQQKADKVNPKAGAPLDTIKPPEFDEVGLIEKIGDFAKKITTEIQAKINGEPDTEVPVKLKAEADELPADLAKFKDQITRAELPFELESQFELVSKQTLDKFGETLVKMADMTEAGLNLMKSAISEFGSFVADTIVDAFDPTNDATFKERFARFLQSLAKQIISTLTQIAVAKLLLNIGVGAAGGTTVAAEGGLVGLADGGEVPDSGRASPNHFGIKAARPKGLDPTDTVPAWLAPGEFVQRASAVARYGADFMSALNQGLLDPGQLRGMAGLSARRSAEVQRARKIRGYADGGLISQQVAASAAAVAESSRAPAVATAPTPAFIVGNDLAADRMLRGGKSAVFDFFREHSSTFKAIIGQ